MDNLEETDKFLETFSPPKLNQEVINSLNRLVTRSEIESIIEELPANKSPRLDCLTVKFFHIYKVEFILIRLKLFQKIEGEGTLPK